MTYTYDMCLIKIIGLKPSITSYNTKSSDTIKLYKTPQFTLWSGGLSANKIFFFEKKILVPVPIVGLSNRLKEFGVAAQHHLLKPHVVLGNDKFWGVNMAKNMI